MLNHVYYLNLIIRERRKEGGGIQSYKKTLSQHSRVWPFFFNLKGIIQGLRKIYSLTSHF